MTPRSRIVRTAARSTTDHSPSLCSDHFSNRHDEIRKKPVLVHERWVAYFKYDRCHHSLCGTCLLRKLKRIEQANHHNWAIKMRRLLLDTCQEVADAEIKSLCATRFKEESRRNSAILNDGK